MTKSIDENSKFVGTGGAEFIGSHFAEHLLNQDKRLTLIDNSSSGRKENSLFKEEFPKKIEKKVKSFQIGRYDKDNY